MGIICLSTDAGDATVLEKARPEIARFISDQACSVLLVMLLISCVRKSFCVLCPNTQMPLKVISNPDVRRILQLFVQKLYSCRWLWGLYPSFPSLHTVLWSALLHVSKIPFQELCELVLLFVQPGNRVVKGFGNSTKDPVTSPCPKVSREAAGCI